MEQGFRLIILRNYTTVITPSVNPALSYSILSDKNMVYSRGLVLH